MTARSKQAKQLAQALAGRIGADPWDVTADYTTYPVPCYLIQYQNGPTAEEMATLASGFLARGRYPALLGTTLRYSRSTSPQAWAARAAASLREGTLWESVAKGAADRRARGVPSSPQDRGLTPEDQALLQHVEGLVKTTAYPDHPSDPADTEVMARLLAAGENNEFTMAALLLAKNRFVLYGELPDGVIRLRRREDRR